MSIVCTSNLGWLISHFDYIASIYECIPTGEKIEFKNELFEINIPYVRRNCRRRDLDYASLKKPIIKDEEVLSIREIYDTLYEEFKHHFESKFEKRNDNNQAQEMSERVYELTKDLVVNAEGANAGPNVLEIICNGRYLFPENCKFFSRDTKELTKYLRSTFDFILLDPPWWNKYIRRKKRKSSHAYEMMYNEDLKDLELENLLHEDSLIAVWCTNSPQHLNALKDKIFPKWGVEMVSKWYWVKVTKSGYPICNFSEPPGKQPYEQIIFACMKKRKIANPPNRKLLVSIPSALHSHKPPLVEPLSIYLPQSPKCLEIFARYLIPGWTSYGNEVLKFQHESLYNIFKANI